jgi:hypothetical protein
VRRPSSFHTIAWQSAFMLGMNLDAFWTLHFTADQHAVPFWNDPE